MVSLTQYLADVHARGVRIAEHPRYGGVNNALHMRGSAHATGHAGDLNFGVPGAPAEERPVLLWAARLAEAAGLNAIYAYYRPHPNPATNANHRDHLHVDDTPISSRGLKPRYPGGDSALYKRILAERRPAGGASRDDDRPPLGRTRKPVRLGTVRLGSRDWKVRNLLQPALADRGYKVGKIDGAFGATTDAAVREFQDDAGLKVDGVVGYKTWYRLCWGARRGQGNTARVRIAKRVAGYTGLSVPGGFGPRTQARWQEIQRGLDVPADGVVGSKTTDALEKKG